MSPEALKTVVKFDKLPSTPEKDAIAKRYLNDEIGPLEFCMQAGRYIEKLEKENNK